jgi:hypothetical protein
MNAPLRFYEDEQLDRLGLPLIISPNLRLLGTDLSRADSRTKEAALSLLMPGAAVLASAIRRHWPNRSRNDAFTVAFTGELTHVFSEVTKQQFPEMQFADAQFAPFITDVPLGKKTFEYHMLSYAGHAEVLNTYAWRQLPRVTVAGDLKTGRLHRFGCCWSITEDDELANKHTSIDLPTELGIAAKRAHHERWDKDFAFGSAVLDLTGFLNHPNVPVIDAPLNAGSTSTFFSKKTAEEIINDFKILLLFLPGITNKIEKPDTVLMAPEEMTELTTRKMSTASDTTIFEFLTKAFRGVTFKECNACAASASYGEFTTNVLFAYKANDKTRVGHVVVEPFRPREPMQDGLEKVVICTSGHGATLWRQPYSGVRMDGVGQS